MVYYGLFDEADAAMLRKCAVFYLAVAGEAGALGFSFEKPYKITAQVIKNTCFP